MADRVLGDLHEHGLARGQHRLDLARLAVLVAERGPVDLAGVEHGVAAAADVDERRLHGGQHVLDPAEVDVADQRGLRLAGDVVLDEDLVLEHADLGEVVALAHDHDAVDRLAAGQELGLADDRRPAPAGLAALAAALLLGLEPGGAGDRGDLVVAGAAAPHPGDGVLRVVGAAAAVLAGTAAAPATPRGAVAGLLLVARRPARCRRRRRPDRVALAAAVGGLAAAAATAAATPARAGAVARAVVLAVARVVVRLGLASPRARPPAPRRPSWPSSSPTSSRSSRGLLGRLLVRLVVAGASSGGWSAAILAAFLAAFFFGFSIASGTWKSTAGAPTAPPSSAGSGGLRGLRGLLGCRLLHGRLLRRGLLGGRLLGGGLLRCSLLGSGLLRGPRLGGVGRGGRLRGGFRRGGGLVLGHVLLLNPTAVGSPGGHRRCPEPPGRSIKPSWRRHPRGVTPSPADPCRGRRP